MENFIIPSSEEEGTYINEREKMIMENSRIRSVGPTKEKIESILKEANEKAKEKIMKDNDSNKIEEVNHCSCVPDIYCLSYTEDVTILFLLEFELELQSRYGISYSTSIITEDNEHDFFRDFEEIVNYVLGRSSIFARQNLIEGGFRYLVDKYTLFSNIIIPAIKEFSSEEDINLIQIDFIYNNIIADVSKTLRSLIPISGNRDGDININGIISIILNSLDQAIEKYVKQYKELFMCILSEE